uniref:Uncharacterized protein n=1 Tax=Anguilla anguilla TaxID=7936 RepID=A0A0E9W936_ANGAN
MLFFVTSCNFQTINHLHLHPPLQLLPPNQSLAPTVQMHKMVSHFFSNNSFHSVIARHDHLQ